MEEYKTLDKQLLKNLVNRLDFIHNDWKAEGWFKEPFDYKWKHIECLSKQYYGEYEVITEVLDSVYAFDEQGLIKQEVRDWIKVD